MGPVGNHVDNGVKLVLFKKFRNNVPILFSGSASQGPMHSERPVVRALVEVSFCSPKWALVSIAISGVDLAGISLPPFTFSASSSKVYAAAGLGLPSLPVGGG